tara:strand:- start:439 stop:582 length:144 start_codon:yes stop_codon:yes gene_type:complete
MDKTKLINGITENLFGKPQNLKSQEVMKNYLNQIEIEKLRYMLKETY